MRKSRLSEWERMSEMDQPQPRASFLREKGKALETRLENDNRARVCAATQKRRKLVQCKAIIVREH